MSVIYTEEDGDIRHLNGKNVGIIGYGNVARPIAMNLRDSGLNIVVGTDSETNRLRATDDFMPMANIEDIVRDGHVIMLLLPNEIAPAVYLQKISPFLQDGHTLIFSSGYNVTYGFIEPPPFVDVGLIAPRTFGENIRTQYQNNQGFYSFVSVGQDTSGNIWNIVLALAKAMGSLQSGAVEITMEQESELDLFIQQTILPAVHHILTTAAEILLENGYPPEAAMMDLYISGELNDYIERATRGGLLQALRLLPLTGQYGTFSRMDRFRDLKMERMMEVTLSDIREGRFSREWSREYASGYPRLKRLFRVHEDMDLWDVEQQTMNLLSDIDEFDDDFDED